MKVSGKLFQKIIFAIYTTVTLVIIDNVSHGSVATPLRCGEMFNNQFKLLLFVHRVSRWKNFENLGI